MAYISLLFFLLFNISTEYQEGHASGNNLNETWKLSFIHEGGEGVTHNNLPLASILLLQIFFNIDQSLLIS
mgnify:FL=1|jgi:hypothetical protein